MILSVKWVGWVTASEANPAIRSQSLLPNHGTKVFPILSGLWHWVLKQLFCTFDVMQKTKIRRDLHLIASIVIVIPIALIYGFFPKSVMPLLLDFEATTTDLLNIFKAIMGLYLAFAVLWLLGILKPNYWQLATLSQIFFMFGLAFGRTLGLFLDGIPSALFCFGTLGEFMLGTFGLYQFQKYKNHDF